jgi:hypothetical protein
MTTKEKKLLVQYRVCDNENVFLKCDEEVKLHDKERKKVVKKITMVINS